MSAALGEEVEVHLFKAVDGQKVFTGILSDFDAQDMVLTIAGEEKRFARKAASLVKPVLTWRASKTSIWARNNPASRFPARNQFSSEMKPLRKQLPHQKQHKLLKG